MKRYIRSESYNYGSRYIIKHEEKGWCVFAYGRIVAGPFYSWIEAQDWVDEKDSE